MMAMKKEKENVEAEQQQEEVRPARIYITSSTAEENSNKMNVG